MVLNKENPLRQLYVCVYIKYIHIHIKYNVGHYDLLLKYNNFLHKFKHFLPFQYCVANVVSFLQLPVAEKAL